MKYRYVMSENKILWNYTEHFQCYFKRITFYNCCKCNLMLHKLSRTCPLLGTNKQIYTSVQVWPKPIQLHGHDTSMIYGTLCEKVVLSFTAVTMNFYQCGFLCEDFLTTHRSQVKPSKLCCFLHQSESTKFTKLHLISNCSSVLSTRYCWLTDKYAGKCTLHNAHVSIFYSTLLQAVKQFITSYWHNSNRARKIAVNLWEFISE